MASTREAKRILINIVGATLDVVGRVAFVPEDLTKQTNAGYGTNSCAGLDSCQNIYSPSP